MNYSKQRELILQTVMESKSHPTAESVYSDLKTDHPRLSLATVYRNLSQLCENGRMRRLHLPDSPDRYDADVVPHCHLLCQQCGAVLDVGCTIADWKQLPDPTVAHRILSCEITFFGICDRCQAKLTTD